MTLENNFHLLVCAFIILYFVKEFAAYRRMLYFSRHAPKIDEMPLVQPQQVLSECCNEPVQRIARRGRGAGVKFNCTECHKEVGWDGKNVSPQFEVHVMDRLTNSMLFSADTFEDAFLRLNEYIGNNPGTLKREQFWFHFGDATGASVALKFGDEHISAHTGGDYE